MCFVKFIIFNVFIFVQLYLNSRFFFFLVKECIEYSEYVYAKDYGNFILLPRMNRENISTCSIVEQPLIIGGVKAAEKEFPHMVTKVE